MPHRFGRKSPIESPSLKIRDVPSGKSIVHVPGVSPSSLLPPISGFGRLQSGIGFTPGGAEHPQVFSVPVKSVYVTISPSPIQSKSDDDDDDSLVTANEQYGHSMGGFASGLQ